MGTITKEQLEENNHTKVVNGKSVLRPSSVAAHCPYNYAQSAILGKYSGSSGASALGTNFHHIAELAMKKKMAGENMELVEAMDTALSSWRQTLQMSDVKFAPKDNPAFMEKQLMDSVNQFITKVAPIINPLAVELRVSAQLPKPSSHFSMVSGSIDLLRDTSAGQVKRITVTDYKLTSKKYSEITSAIQVELYRQMVEGMRAEFEIPDEYIVDAQLFNFVKMKQLKKEVKDGSFHIVTPLSGQVVQNQLYAKITSILDTAELYHALINRGVDPEEAVAMLYPTTLPVNSFLCSETWCSWWNECPINNPNKVSKFNILDVLTRRDMRDTIQGGANG